MNCPTCNRPGALPGALVCPACLAELTRKEQPPVILNVWSDASAHVAAFLGNVQGGAPISGEKLERLIALTSACCLLWEIMVGSGAKRLEPIKEAAQALRLAAMAESIP